MLREIKLYGQLAKFVGHRKLEAAVSNAAEAVRFLLANFPGLDQHMAERHYKVLTGDYALTMEELHNPSGQQAIKIVPVVGGAGGGDPVSNIFIGFGLIAASFFFPGAGLFGATSFFGATATTGALATIGTAVSYIGASLVLGGVAQMLSPVPTTAAINSIGGTGGTADPRESYSFSGVQNVSRQGVPVPIIFGEVICGSVTVSAGIDVAQVSV